MRSRYKTALLELDDELPIVTSAQALAKNSSGTLFIFAIHFCMRVLSLLFLTKRQQYEGTSRGLKRSLDDGK